MQDLTGTVCSTARACGRRRGPDSVTSQGQLEAWRLGVARDLEITRTRSLFSFCFCPRFDSPSSSFLSSSSSSSSAPSLTPSPLHPPALLLLHPSCASVFRLENREKGLGSYQTEPTGSGGTKKYRDRNQRENQLSSSRPIIVVLLLSPSTFSLIFLLLFLTILLFSLFLYLSLICSASSLRSTHPGTHPSMADTMSFPRIAPPTPDPHSRSNSFSAGLGIEGLPTPTSSTFDPSLLSPLVGTFPSNVFSTSPERSSPPGAALSNGAARRGGPFNFQPMVASKSPPIGKPVCPPVFVAIFYLTCFTRNRTNAAGIATNTRASHIRFFSNRRFARRSRSLRHCQFQHGKSCCEASRRSSGQDSCGVSVTCPSRGSRYGPRRGVLLSRR